MVTNKVEDAIEISLDIVKDVLEYIETNRDVDMENVIADLNEVREILKEAK